MENSVSVNETAVMNSIKNGMKNLLFIEGNRSEIDKANVVESYNKIKGLYSYYACWISPNRTGTK